MTGRMTPGEQQIVIGALAVLALLLATPVALELLGRLFDVCGSYVDTLERSLVDLARVP